MVRNQIRYASLALSAAALGWLAWHGVFPQRNPIRPSEYIIAEDQLNPHQWRKFISREDVIIALTFVFATSGPTVTLPADFNTASNQINAIGSGTGGAGGGAVVPCGCSFIGGTGGAGGGGGAFAQIVNYSGHTAGQAVNVTVGAGDTVFDTSAILLAKAASGSTGGQASSSVGTTKFSGGSGGTGAAGTACNGGTGGGAGGAAGPHGAGNNGSNGGAGGMGGTGDAGNTASGANGTQFDASHGSGGGGGGGVSPSGGANGGRYGGGGGGGGGAPICGSPGGGGNAFQGLIAIGYTPAAAGGARSYGFVIG